jgi:hypothetical protein
MQSWHFSTSPSAEQAQQNGDFHRHFDIASLRCRSQLNSSTGSQAVAARQAFELQFVHCLAPYE